MVNAMRAVFGRVFDKSAKKRSYSINRPLAHTLPNDAAEAKW